MTVRLRPLALFVLAALLGALVLACGGSKGGDASSAAASPTVAAAPAMPAGWHAFSDGAYSGAIRDAWQERFIDLTGTDLSQLPSIDLPSSLQTMLASAAASGLLHNVFIVVIDQGPTFATSINVLPCETGLDATLAADKNAWLAAYRAAGIQAAFEGQVTYAGQPFDLMHAQLGSSFDTYQAYIRSGDCYQPVTLSTRPGDKAQVDDLRTFLSLLHVDTTRLAP